MEEAFARIVLPAEYGKRGAKKLLDQVNQLQKYSASPMGHLSMIYGEESAERFQEWDGVHKLVSYFYLRPYGERNSRNYNMILFFADGKATHRSNPPIYGLKPIADNENVVYHSWAEAVAKILAWLRVQLKKQSINLTYAIVQK